jgi:hypothetical protein
LGKWTKKNKKEWLWYYFPPEERLYCSIRGRWSFWRKSHQRTRSQRFVDFDSWTELQPHHRAFKVSGNVLSNTQAMVHYVSPFEQEYQTTPEQEPGSLQVAIEWLPPELAWSAERFTLRGFSQQLAISIVKGTVIAVSNGSLKNDSGTAAYHIEDPSASNDVFLEGVLQVILGTPRDSTSHRSELGGL